MAPVRGHDAVLLLARTHALRPERLAVRTLPADASVVGTARRLAERQLAAWDLADAAHTTELIISELVTNAIRHGEGPIQLRLIHDRAACWPRSPTPVAPAPTCATPATSTRAAAASTSSCGSACGGGAAQPGGQDDLVEAGAGRGHGGRAGGAGGVRRGRGAGVVIRRRRAPRATGGVPAPATPAVRPPVPVPLAGGADSLGGSGLLCREGRARLGCGRVAGRWVEGESGAAHSFSLPSRGMPRPPRVLPF